MFRLPGLFSKMASTLDDAFSSFLARRQSRGILRRLAVPDKNLIDFSSNDYLSLTRNPEIKHEYLTRLQTSDDDFGLGSRGSRLLDGNTPLAESLESSLAEFHGAGAALLFNSGYEANTGLFACAPQPGDILVLDELVHASVRAGVHLSRAGRVLSFGHNCVWDAGPCLNLQKRTEGVDGNSRASLAAVLRCITEGKAGKAVRDGRRHVFVAVEALYSMDGDSAPLDDIIRCIEYHLPLGNGHLVVDEAHSSGLMGNRGRGLVCELGLESQVWARVHTFGKAYGCSGAVILCSPITRAYLINYARTFIYTTAMGFPGLVSIQVAHQFMASGRAEVLRSKLRGLIEYTRARLSKMCVGNDPSTPWGPLMAMNSSKLAQSPIIPIFTRQARSLAAHCQNRGYMVRAIMAPTVPQGTERVRICLHAGNTMEECEGLCKAIEEWSFGQLEAQRQQTLIAGESHWATHSLKNKL